MIRAREAMVPIAQAKLPLAKHLPRLLAVPACGAADRRLEHADAPLAIACKYGIDALKNHLFHRLQPFCGEVENISL